MLTPLGLRAKGLSAFRAYVHHVRLQARIQPALLIRERHVPRHIP